MAWLDIRRKRTSVYCSPSNLETTNGRAQCHEVCSQHFCCVEPDPTSLESCARDPSRTCDVYESCRKLRPPLLEDRESILDGAFDGHTLINIDGSEMDVDMWTGRRGRGRRGRTGRPRSTWGTTCPTSTRVSWTSSGRRRATTS